LLKWTGRACLLLGLCCLGTWTAVSIDAALYQRTLRHRLEALLAYEALLGTGSGADRSAGANPALDADGLVGLIEIPRLALSALVIEGVDGRTLHRAVGHLPGTALPGTRGHAVLAGHRDSFFRPLEEVRAHDRVLMTTPHGLFTYEVEDVSIVEPDRVDVLAPSDTATLTLITCYPFRYIGPAPRRFIVRARQVPATGDS
jgi:sortase A